MNSGKYLRGKQVGILYHYTPITSIRDIIRDNFQLKDFEFNRGYISFTRDGSGILGRGSAFSRFVLDGNKLSNNIIVSPDSVAKSNGKLASDNDGNILYKTGIKKQAEERVYIKSLNIKPYLLGIQIIKQYADFDLSDDEHEYINQQIAPLKLQIVDKFTPYK